MASTSERAVNDLLHTLRGEQFRHAQNVQRSRTHISASRFSHNSPTLPFSLDHQQHEPLVEQAVSKQTGQDPVAWRAQALSVVLSLPSTSLPSLAILCLRILASYPVDQFIHDIAPHLPSHLRRDLIRDSAIHSPIPNAKLYALYEPDGHADNELLIVGPAAELRDGFFLRSASDVNANSNRPIEENESWDTERFTPEPLTTLIIISTRIAVSSLLSLPPTLTKMALVNLPTSISVHRLPHACPLLVILDLSYNTWLALEDDAEKILERVEWSRWNHLHVLGLRGCHASHAMRAKLNRGRWDDVEVIQ